MTSSSSFTVTFTWIFTSLLPFTSWSKNESASYSPSGHERISSRKRRSVRLMVCSTAERTVSAPYFFTSSLMRRAPSWAAPTCARRSPSYVGVRLFVFSR